MSALRRPEIIDVYVTPALPTDPIGETRVRPGEAITIVAEAGLPTSSM